MMFTSLVFWLGLFLIPFSTLIIDVTYKVISTSTHKSLTDAVRESEIRKSDPGIIMAESKTHGYHRSQRGNGSGFAAWNSLLKSNQRIKFNFHLRALRVLRDIYYNGREFLR